MTYDVQVLDNRISDELRQRVWEYLENSRWCATWKAPSAAFPKFGDYIPAKDPARIWYSWQHRLNLSTLQHRAAFASDETTLQQHPALLELWNCINQQFDNQFEITGHPEGMPADPKDTSWQPPQPANSELKPGWRVYANAQFDESQKRTHGVHRDSPFVDDDSYYTILFCANPEWYPTWFADCVYYDEDPEGLTGDDQTFQNLEGMINQNRKFKIGWPSKIVSPVPGRIICYDGRTLHTTHPASIWCTVPRRVVAFRVRKKK